MSASAEAGKRIEASQEVERVSPVRHERGVRERDRRLCAGKWESGMEGTGRESRDPHPADSYNFNHQLATLLPPRGRVICEKHVDLREEEGWPYSFISSYISCKRLSLLPRRRSVCSPVKRTTDARARDDAILRIVIIVIVLIKRLPRFMFTKRRKAFLRNHTPVSFARIQSAQTLISASRSSPARNSGSCCNTQRALAQTLI